MFKQFNSNKSLRYHPLKNTLKNIILKLIEETILHVFSFFSLSNIHWIVIYDLAVILSCISNFYFVLLRIVYSALPLYLNLVKT